MAHKLWIANNRHIPEGTMLMFHREPQFTHGRTTAKKAWRARGKQYWVGKYDLKTLGLPVPKPGECIEVTVRPGRTWVPRG